MSLTLSCCEALAIGRPAPSAQRRCTPIRPLRAAATLKVERDRATRLNLAPGSRIDCLSGQVWITLDGDLRDIVLDAGDAFVVDRKRPVMIFAFDAPAELRIGAPAVASRAPLLTGWRTALAYVAVVAGSVLALFGARYVVAEWADLAAAVSLSASADPRGTPGGRPLRTLTSSPVPNHSLEGAFS